MEGLDMYLMKSCQKKHNIIESNSIRVGTLFGFRTLENLELQDESEASYDYIVRIIEANIPSEVFVYVAAWEIGDENFPYNSVSTPLNSKQAKGIWEAERIRSNRYDVDVTDMKIYFTSLHHNCFVFCMSMSEYLPTQPKFKGYDDYWYFKHNDATAFSEEIKELITKKIKDSNNPLGIDNFNPDLIEVKAKHGMVMYNKKTSTISRGDEANLIQLIKRLENICFTKYERYKKDEEYRFCFEVFYDKIPISINMPYIDLSLPLKLSVKIQ